MTKEELAALVAEILAQQEPMVKGSDYKPAEPGPSRRISDIRKGTLCRMFRS